jgi:hypothetical protein
MIVFEKELGIVQNNKLVQLYGKCKWSGIKDAGVPR